MYEDLRKIRTERGIRLKECADVIGVQEACYCKKELGDLKFSLEEAKALADFFKLPVEVLFLKKNLPKWKDRLFYNYILPHGGKNKCKAE